jgi:hypothetical protein
LPVITRFAGSTISELGAMPKLHCITAFMQTCCPISYFQSIACLQFSANPRDVRFPLP